MKTILIVVVWWSHGVAQNTVATYPNVQACLNAAQVYEQTMSQGTWAKGICIPAPSDNSK
jgi:hypothetical protein